MYQLFLKQKKKLECVCASGPSVLREVKFLFLFLRVHLLYWKSSSVSRIYHRCTKYSSEGTEDICLHDFIPERVKTISTLQKSFYSRGVFVVPFSFRGIVGVVLGPFLWLRYRGVTRIRHTAHYPPVCFLNTVFRTNLPDFSCHKLSKTSQNSKSRWNRLWHTSCVLGLSLSERPDLRRTSSNCSKIISCMKWSDW